MNFNKLDAAEDLYREYFAARPSSILIYAEFRGRHGRTDAAAGFVRHGHGSRYRSPTRRASRQLRSTSGQTGRHAGAVSVGVNKWIDQGLASAKRKTR